MFVVMKWGKKLSIAGVFTSRTLAVAACKSWRYGYGPVNLDEVLPDKLTDWPDFVYPIERKPTRRIAVTYLAARKTGTLGT